MLYFWNAAVNIISLLIIIKIDQISLLILNSQDL